MKKIIAFLVILLVSFTMVFSDMARLDSIGMLCNTPITPVYRAIANVISEISSFFSVNEVTYTDYTVTVVDGLGKPISDVMVKFTNTDGETKTRVTDTDGKAFYKNAPAVDYKVILEQGFSNAFVDGTVYNINADVTDIKIVLRDMSKTIDLVGEVADGSFAYFVDEGSYQVTADEFGTAYYVFDARITGTYKISIITDNSDATVGYYGIPMFVQSTHRAEGDYDGRSFELIVQDPETPYVIGVKNFGDDDVVLVIDRIGEAPFDPEYAEWTQIKKQADIDKCEISSGVVLKDVDVTDSNISVNLGDDGLYYTNDGKLVYIKVTGTNEAYLPGASLAYLAGYVDNNIGMNIGGYIYDENGDFVEKRNYNLMIEEYMKYCDSKYGVVPLTEELAECMMLHGTSTGWWNPSAGNYLFNGVDVVLENAWLFLCMVEE